MNKPLKTVGYGRYRLLNHLGDGTLSDVYQAHDTEIDDQVAVKLLTLDGRNKDIAHTMFSREVDALQGLKHEHIVELLGSFSEVEKDHLGLVLELVPEGKTLQDFIVMVQKGQLPRKTIGWRIQHLLKLLSALEVAHRRNVIHRDIKPKNILYKRTHDQFKLVDFGIARVLAHYGQKRHDVTLRHYHSPPFSAPEQRLQEETSFSTDLYAFGVVAASLLTFTLPDQNFKSKDLVGFLKPLQDEISREHPVAYDLLEQLIHGLLRDNPAERWRLPEVERILQQAQAEVADKPTAYLKLTRNAREGLKAIDSRFANESLALSDFNVGLRGTYRQVEFDGRKESQILLYGQNLRAGVRISQNDPEQLVVIFVSKDLPDQHARNREQAQPLAFTLEFGIGNAKELLDALYEQHIVHEDRKRETQQRKNIFKVAEFLLELQRRRLERIALQCTQVEKGDRTAGWHHDGEFCVLQINDARSAPRDQEESDEEAETRRILSNDELVTVLDEKAGIRFNDRFAGRVHQFNPSTLELVLKLDRRMTLPESLELVVTNAATETNLRRQEDALERFTEGDIVNDRLSDLITHPERNTVSQHLPADLIQDLEPARDIKKLVGRILAAEDIFLLQGPPGTGKTTLIAEVMAQILTHNPDSRILLTSQANEAVNNALDALRGLALKHHKDWRIVRDVSEHRKVQDQQHSFSALFEDWAISTDAMSTKAFAKQQSQFSPDQQLRVQKILSNWKENLTRYDDVQQDYNDSAHVIGATCLRVPALRQKLSEVTFDWVIVDEAAKATPTEVLVSLISGKKILLVGDHKQLPPFIGNDVEDALEEKGFTVQDARRSLFEDLFDQMPDSNRAVLNTQYRMHKSIADMVSMIAYEDTGGLKTGVKEEDRQIELDRYNKDHRVFWIDVPHGQERQDANSTSYYNDQEAQFIYQELKRIDEELLGKGVKRTVGVIAPYLRQVHRLEETIMPEAGTWKNIDIEVATVDAFQGKQKDIIVYSMTRSSYRNWHFVANVQRLNVAFSRARRLLIIVGHQEAAGNTPDLLNIMQAIPTENCLSMEGVKA